MKFNLFNFIKQAWNILFYPVPNMLVFFVTGQCNARCKMCFYPTTPYISKNELTLDEIRKVSLSLGPLHWLLLSGGEPFLRKDLPELCRIFIENNKVKYLQIPTNGWNPKLISSMTEKILKDNPELPNLVINLSIDHTGKDHDQIRGIPGLYKKVCQTAVELNKLKSKYKNLGVAGNITYSGYNDRDIFTIYEKVKKDMGLDNISLSLMRGTPRDKKAGTFGHDNFFKLFRQIEKSDQYQYYSFWKRVLAKGKDYFRWLIIYNAHVRKQFTLPCRAGRNVAVLNEKGNVYACELRDDKLGNIRDFGYNFRKVWKSENIKKARKDIVKNKCYCTYECVIGPNVLFHPWYLLRSVWYGLFRKQGK